MSMGVGIILILVPLSPKQPGGCTKPNVVKHQQPSIPDRLSVYLLFTMFNYRQVPFTWHISDTHSLSFFFF